MEETKAELVRQLKELSIDPDRATEALPKLEAKLTKDLEVAEHELQQVAAQAAKIDELLNES